MRGPITAEDESRSFKPVSGSCAMHCSYGLRPRANPATDDDPCHGYSSCTGEAGYCGEHVESRPCFCTCHPRLSDSEYARTAHG